MHGHIISSSGMSVSPSGFVFFFLPNVSLLPRRERSVVTETARVPAVRGRAALDYWKILTKKETYVYIYKKKNDNRKPYRKRPRARDRIGREAGTGKRGYTAFGNETGFVVCNG